MPQKRPNSLPHSPKNTDVWNTGRLITMSVSSTATYLLQMSFCAWFLMKSRRSFSEGGL